MKSPLIVPYKIKTPLGNFEYGTIWKPESFAEKIKDDIPHHLLPFIRRAEPLLDNVWLPAISSLLSRHSTTSNSEIEKVRITYRAAILEQIIKLRWNSSFSANLRLPKREIRVLKLEGELWNCAINLMLELSLISPLRYPLTPIWFTLCLMEGALGAFNPQVDQKIEFRKILQSSNQALKANLNPFNQEESPLTWQLIEDSQIITEQNDQFRKRIYTPLRKAREKLVAHLIYSPAQIIDETTLEKRRALKRSRSKGF